MKTTACGTLCLLLFSCAKAATTPHTTEQPKYRLKNYSFKHDDVMREVAILDPRETPDESLRPLVIALHGGLGEDDETIRLSFGKLNGLAFEEDFLLVYPNGIGGHWNDGRNVDRYLAHRAELKDVDFIVTLIDDFVEDWNVNPDEVFVVGVSGGAMLAHRLACERPDKLRAISAVIGAVPRNVAKRRWRCKKTDPVSVLMISGTEDPIVPWEGGDVQYDGAKLGKVLSAEEAFEFWLKRNQCKETNQQTLPDVVPGDGTRIRRQSSTDCDAGARVELIAIEGAGHTWPSGWQYLPEETVGRISRELEAADASWAFFAGSLMSDLEPTEP